MVTNGNTHGQTLTISLEGTGANGKDLGLVLLLDAALGQEDTGGSLGLGLDALDQDAVQEGSEVLDVTEERLEQWNGDVSNLIRICSCFWDRNARDWEGSSWRRGRKSSIGGGIGAPLRGGITMTYHFDWERDGSRNDLKWCRESRAGMGGMRLRSGEKRKKRRKRRRAGERPEKFPECQDRLVRPRVSLST